MDIAEALRASDSDLHPKGETFPQDQRVYRVKVVRTFLRAGVYTPEQDPSVPRAARGGRSTADGQTPYVRRRSIHSDSGTS